MTTIRVGQGRVFELRRRGLIYSGEKFFIVTKDRGLIHIFFPTVICPDHLSMVQQLHRYTWDEWEKIPRGIIIPESPFRLDYGDWNFADNITNEEGSTIIRTGFSTTQFQSPGINLTNLYDKYRVSVGVEQLTSVHEICGRKIDDPDATL